MTLHWTASTLDELAPRSIHAIFKLRVDVFVVEQECAYPGVDDADLIALHLLGHVADGRLVAYARILPAGPDGMPHIGRVVVHPAFRDRRLGHTLMEQALEVLRSRTGSTRAALAAQEHLQGFYSRHGFVATSAVYDLDGIPHVDMERGTPSNAEG